MSVGRPRVWKKGKRKEKRLKIVFDIYTIDLIYTLNGSWPFIFIKKRCLTH